jgi:hypothetical protein
VLARARRLTAAEGLALLAANRTHIIGHAELTGALRDVIYAMNRAGRAQEVEAADRGARAAVTVFAGTPRAKAVAGIVGRTVQVLVVEDGVTSETLAFLTQPWRKVIGGV